MFYSPQLFNYDKDYKTFTAEVSDLDGYSQFCKQGTFGNVVAGHTGLYLQSSRTKEVVRFLIVARRDDADGDIMWWDLKPYEQDARAFSVEDVTMRIYND